MDVDYLNSPTQLEQMDLMTLMMQMEKLPEYSELLSPSIEYSNGHSPSLYSTPPSSSLIGQSSPISFCQEQLLTTLHSDTPAGIPTGDADLCYPYLDPRTTAMRDVIFHISAMQPVDTDPVSVKPVKRRMNVKISKDPQSVAARHRRERISERIRVLQRLVPGGTKMDTASMLDEAVHYVKFLKAQVQTLERAAANWNQGFGFPSAAPIAMGRTYQSTDHQLLFNSMQMLS